MGYGAEGGPENSVEEGLFGSIRSTCGCRHCAPSATLDIDRTKYGEEGGSSIGPTASDREAAYLGNQVPQALTGSDSTGNIHIDALAVGGSSRWNAGSDYGTSVTVTYSFMDEVPSYEFGIVNFQEFTDTMKEMARAALAEFSAAAGLTFVEVSDDGAGGQIRFGSDYQSFSAGYAYYP